MRKKKMGIEEVALADHEAGVRAPGALNLPEKKWSLFAPEHRHLLLLLYFPVYLISFFILEHNITAGYWVSYFPLLDDKIPFVPCFVIPYYLWYPFIFVPGIYFLFRDVPTFKLYMYNVILGYSLGLLICAVFPNGQNLRPTSFSENTLCTRMVKAIYSVDTNTNVLPSMHVIGTLAVVSAVMHSPHTKNVLIRASSILIAVLICASTVFIKQHSILDIFAGILVSALVHLLIYKLVHRIKILHS